MKQKLFTKEIQRRLVKNAHHADSDPLAVMKLFNPVGAGTWYVTAADVYDSSGIRPITESDNLISIATDEDSDVLLHAYVTGLGYPEFGDVSLKEILALRLPFGLSIERDHYFTPKKISELKKYD